MKRLFTFFVMAVLSLTATAQQVDIDYPELTRESFTASNGVAVPYRELMPTDASEDNKYPLVLFMHGAGERGDDNLAQLRHGAGMFTSPQNMEQYPAIVLFPQCSADKYWIWDKPERPAWGTPQPLSSSIEAVMELLDGYLASGKVDLSRVYVMGISMGGMATFDIITRYPGIFAAAIPICGAVDTTRFSEDNNDVKVRIYHGDMDDVVPPVNSRNAYYAMKKVGYEVSLREFCGVGHDSWNPAFNTPGFLEWLFNQHR